MTDDFTEFFRTTVRMAMEQALERKRSAEEKWFRDADLKLQRGAAEAWRDGRWGGFKG